MNKEHEYFEKMKIAAKTNNQKKIARAKYLYLKEKYKSPGGRKLSI